MTREETVKWIKEHRSTDMEIDFIQPKKTVGKLISVDVLDKIRAEIEELKPNNPNFKGYYEQNVALNKVLDIIDKYREEME